MLRRALDHSIVRTRGRCQRERMPWTDTTRGASSCITGCWPWTRGSPSRR